MLDGGDLLGSRGERLRIPERGIAGLVAERAEVRPVREREPHEGDGPVPTGELVDDAILNEPPELADDDFYDRLAEMADRYAEVSA